ncbi:type IV pilus twitching motility protein PilT [Aggregicoccus sp. 17bor-14]|uniref:type IV pilus twitching motility protein PilT n=1 Tax=Myxococcaceae TaxID=31 RepID=UPI00129C328A|nr:MULTISPECIES: type IV pilus twitching motility protein PilT [Myxococcaceae]MBF5042234.1 type IV pilus twitching motility protein PilT [Simulacricoccus sp. 17bor-14]MRI88010.1 type IV pilus twitching motility protein PilT [Aggregicoccus sp. 17bor-14]
MPKLDAAIEKLFRQGATEFVLRTGELPQMLSPSGAQPVLKQSLNSAQVIALIAELAPYPLQEALAREGTQVFSYASTPGRVRVQVELVGGHVIASVRPEAMAMAPPPSPAPAAAPAPAPAPRAAAEPVAPLPNVVVPVGEQSQRKLPPADARGAMEFLLKEMVSRRASDLHLSSDTGPMFRIDGDICADPALRPMTPERLKELLWSIAPERNREEWERTKDTDFAHETADARFRVNVFADRRGIGAVLRQIPTKIKSAEELGLSSHLLELCHLTKGLVLVTGPTGSGKSTTLAAMLDYVNTHRSDHIITIEDPIEFVHPNKKCLVNQREIGVHTQGFKNALRAALREDPDVVLVGELRDLETISIAIETAETGHLVFGTLHTNTAPSTVDRIIDQFPTDRQAQVRTMLSESLKGVVSQTLCKRIGGGRAAALEVLLGTGSVANLIREGKTFQLPSIMQTGKAAGMVTLNDALFDLVKRGVVAPADALSKAVAKTEFKAMLERGGFKLEQAAAA